MLIALSILCAIVERYQTFGPINEFVYFAALTVVIAFHGQAAASRAYYGFRAGPDAVNCSTEEELDSEGRRRASTAFEEGAKRGLLVAGIPGFVAWLLVRLLV
jgi:hypothetical protein